MPMIGCCNGPGLVGLYARTYGYLENIEDRNTGAPCWFEFAPNQVNPCYGYDSTRDWGIGSLVGYVDVRSCGSGSGLTITGTLFDGASILAGAGAPDTSTTSSGYDLDPSRFFAVCKRSIDDDYRVYGRTLWLEPGSPSISHCKVFSVKYDGSDYTEHVNFTTSDHSNESIGKTIVVCGDGDIITTEASLDAGVECRVRVNGSTTYDVTTSDTPTAAALVDANAFAAPPGAMAASTRGGSPLILVPWRGLSASADFDTGLVKFAFTHDGTDSVFRPISMAWSDKINGIMIVWLWDPLATMVSAFDPLPPAPPSAAYVTLVQGTLSAGNIVGQDGVLIYDFAIAGLQYDPFINVPLSSAWATCINYCALPRPSDLEPADVEVPFPDCATLYDDCEAPGPLQAVVSFGEDCTNDDGMGNIENRNGSVINGPWTLENELTFSGPSVVPCVSYDKNGYGIPLFDLTAAPFDGSGTIEDEYAAIVAANAAAANAVGGITKPYREIIATGSVKNELWVYAVSAKVACDGGQIFLTEFHVATVQANFSWSGTDWELASLFLLPSCTQDWTDIIFKAPAIFFPGCTTILEVDSPIITSMVTRFVNDVCGTPSDSGLEVTAYIDLPPP